MADKDNNKGFTLGNIDDTKLVGSMPAGTEGQAKGVLPTTLSAGTNIADMLGVKLPRVTSPVKAMKVYDILPGKGRGTKGWDGYPFDSLGKMGAGETDPTTGELKPTGFEIVGIKNMEACRNAAGRWAKVTGKGVVTRTVGKTGEGEFEDYEPKNEIVFAVIRNR